jgi:hypothetical protein
LQTECPHAAVETGRSSAAKARITPRCSWLPLLKTVEAFAPGSLRLEDGRGCHTTREPAMSPRWLATDHTDRQRIVHKIHCMFSDDHRFHLLPLLALPAALLIAACSSSSAGPCAAPPTPISVTPDLACRVAQACVDTGMPCYTSSACKEACPGQGAQICALPTEYVAAYRSANSGDAGVARDGGAVVCPPETSTVTVQCEPYCA